MSASNTAREIQWGPCCFCGKQIQQTEVDPCRVTVETASKRWQVWFCHANCFRGHLADNGILSQLFFDMRCALQTFHPLFRPPMHIASL
jgi:hypothetical protein